MEHNQPPIEIDVIFKNPAWNEILPNVEEVVTSMCLSTLHYLNITQKTQHIEVAIVLTDNTMMQQLNKQYRNKDHPTNVLSFPSHNLIAGQYDNLKTAITLGDIVLGLEAIQCEARAQEKTLQNHLSHLIVHGTLHLLGYDHKAEDEASQMETIETKILLQKDISDPYVEI